MKQSPGTAADRPSLDDCWNRIGVRGDGSCPELKQQVHCRNCPIYSSAAAVLLDRDLPPGHLTEWTRHFARARQIDELDTHSVVIFRIAAEWLALPTLTVVEVTDPGPVHSLPYQRDSTVLGLTNVRGELLICVSLGNVLGLEQAVAMQAQRNVYRRMVVIQREGKRLVFPVDEVHGVYRFHPRELQEVPATVAEAAARYTRALLPWSDGTGAAGTAGCLDEPLLFHTLARSLA